MKKRLLFSITKKDLEISYFSGKGAGGQHRNKHRNCCRIRHPESGAAATGQEHRSKEKNTRAALHRLVETAKFKIWHARKVAEVREKKTIDEIVAEQMRPENLKVEVRNEDDTRWIPEEQ